MKTTISNIDDYIKLFPPPEQKMLEELRTIISEAAPLAEETISYGMPTFRWNGNLIHFALFKKHLGVYPGSRAIEHFGEELSHYKTTKGAIQIPLHEKLPKKLITKIIHFNQEILSNKKETNWKKFTDQWSKEIEKVQGILSTFPLDRTLKWGNDVFTYNNKNILSYAGFKNHFAIWFYNGVFINDTENVLVSGTEGNTKSLRQWRFTSANSMPEEKIKDYIQQAIQIVIDGKTLPAQRLPLKNIDGHLKETLSKNDLLNEKFNQLTKSQKNEYISYIQDAKKDKTKSLRIEKISPLIMEGKGLNDRYKK